MVAEADTDFVTPPTLSERLRVPEHSRAAQRLAGEDVDGSRNDPLFGG